MRLGATIPHRGTTRQPALPLGRARSGDDCQAGFSAVLIGLPVLGPALQRPVRPVAERRRRRLFQRVDRADRDAAAVGAAPDRIGERIVLASGLAGCGCLPPRPAGRASFWLLVALLTMAGALGASVNAASGRAVMQWFSADQRGLALGVRQTAIPIGGAVAALALPAVNPPRAEGLVRVSRCGVPRGCALFAGARGARGARARGRPRRRGRRVDAPRPASLDPLRPAAACTCSRRSRSRRSSCSSCTTSTG